MHAELRTLPVTAPPSWAAICDAHPNQWVCLADVHWDAAGAIDAGRVVSCAPSINALLALLGAPSPDGVVVHTGGRGVHSPRAEPTDEARELVRSRR